MQVARNDMHAWSKVIDKAVDAPILRPSMPPRRAEQMSRTKFRLE
jgi:hypothetical protein